MSWTDTPVMVLDFETTSVDPCRTRPVQIGFAIFDPMSGSFTNELNDIVNSGVKSTPGALKIHGITDARAVRQGAPIKQAFKSLAETITKYCDYPIMMYNALFDFTILNQECKRHGLQLPGLNVLDPLVWAQKFSHKPHKLGVMAERFGIPHENAHDALADVRTTAKVALSITQANSILGTASIEELQTLQKEWSRGSWPERLCAQPSASNNENMTGEPEAGDTSAKNNSNKSPEEIQLGMYEEQVTQAEGQMLELETELASMRRSIKWFGYQMTATILPLVIKIHILEVEVAAAGGDKADLDKALQALKKLLGDYSDAHITPPDSDAGANLQEEPADDALKSMFRDAAKQVHPDLADDERDQKLRTSLMADLNEAYAKGDKDAIGDIIDQYNVSEESVQGEGVEFDLVRIIRRLHRIRQHITDLESMKANIEKSDEWSNVLHAREAEDQDGDYFSKYSEKLMKQIEYMETQLGYGIDTDDLVVAAERVLDRFDNKSDDQKSLLERLSRLRESGVITNIEFEEQKRRILEASNSAARTQSSNAQDPASGTDGVEEQDLHGWNLHRAAARNRVDIARLLIDRGANIEAKNDVGARPLQMAASANSLDVARLLIERGAEVDAKNKVGLTPLHTTAWSNSIDVARLLIDRGADIEAKDNAIGATPLHQAAASTSLDVARLLIDQGAYIEGKDRTGSTPLQLAAHANSLDIARLLIDRGANIEGIDLSWMDD